MSKSDNIVPLPEAKDIDAQAAAWIMRFEDGETTGEEIAAFQAWRNASEQHANAYERLSALWSALDAVEELTDYAASDDNIALIEGALRPRFLTRRNAAFAAAASVVLLAGAGLFYQNAALRNPGPAIYQTAVGEQKTVDLADGSAIELNTDSKVEVTYTRTARNVELMQGEAYFTVAPNKKKPFSVYAGKGVVTAVGTAFSVRLHNGLVDVLVAKGRVALSTGAPVIRTKKNERAAPVVNAKPLLQISNGEAAVFEDKIESLDHIEPTVLNRKLSWRDGLLEFSGEDLAEVVADVSRYTDTTIDIEGDSLRNLPVTGYLKVGHVDDMFEALATMADVRVERLSANHVRLSPKD